jgi:hypothetical protein
MSGIPKIGRPEIKLAIGRSDRERDCHVAPCTTHLLRAGRKILQDLLNRIADPLLALLGPTR